MKTIFIWDECEGNLEYFTEDGDFSHLDGVYINSATEEQALQDELNMLAYDQKNQTKRPMLADFPIEVAQEDDVKVISCGFFP